MQFVSWGPGKLTREWHRPDDMIDDEGRSDKLSCIRPDPKKNLTDARTLMRYWLDLIVGNPVGAFVVLAFAAYLEAYGDSCFQQGLYRSSGGARVIPFVGGALVLSLYGLVVNLPRWDFGKLLGVYVVLFFIMAQVLNKVRFNVSPTPPILVGGGLIAAGGLVITFWKP
jgi:hypothetical protein